MNPQTMTRRAAITTAAALCATPWAAAQGAETARLKFTSFEPPMANITANVLTPFARNASGASKGTLQIDMFAGGTLGRNPLQQLKLVTDGIADIGWIVLPYTPGRFDDSEVVGLPFVSSNATEASLALHRLYEAGTLAGFDDLKMLAVAATPPVGIHGKQLYRNPADLKGKRVRVSGDHLTRVVEALGGAPVSLGAGQIAESLSRGVVDMTLNNWGFVGDFKVNEVTTHHFDIGLGAVAVGVVMRKDRFDALPEAARQAIEQFSGEALARQVGAAFDRQEQEVRDRVSKSGKNQVQQPTATEVDAWQKAVGPVNEAWLSAKPRNQPIYSAFVEQLRRIRANA